MYGLFTKLGLGAVVSAGLSVLGISYLCTEPPANHHPNRPPTVVAVHADAALGVAPASPGRGPGSGANAGSNPNRGSGTSPGTSSGNGSGSSSGSNRGSNNGANSGSNPQHPTSDCGCDATNPALINVKPVVDVDVDVDADAGVTLSDSAVTAPVVAGPGTVGDVVDGVLPDCGCNPGGSPAHLFVSVLGH
jgi:hypothetical protein